MLRSTSVHKAKPPREVNFDIGDCVCLITNPQWIGVVVARSLSEKVNVLWDNHGIEQVESRLLQFAGKKTLKTKT